MRTVSLSYSTISLPSLAELLCVDAARAEALAREQPGWTVEGDMVRPAKTTASSSSSATAANPPDWKLKQITDYISFLE